MDAVNVDRLYAETPRTMMADMCALVQDVPDPASVAILAVVLSPDYSLRTQRNLQQTVRERYREFTWPGSPDGPPLN